MTWAQVTLLQLEQRYGTSPDALEFIAELTKGWYDFFPNQNTIPELD